MLYRNLTNVTQVLIAIRSLSSQNSSLLKIMTIEIANIDINDSQDDDNNYDGAVDCLMIMTTTSIQKYI